MGVARGERVTGSERRASGEESERRGARRRERADQEEVGEEVWRKEAGMVQGPSWSA